MAKKFKLSKNSQNNLSGVKDSIILLVERSLAKSKHDFGIPSSGGLRTAAEQYLLYMMEPKVTNCDGYKKLSNHQSGDAFDIFVYDEHGACWNCKDKYKEIYNTIENEFNLMKDECIFLELDELMWGGNWRFKDLPHFQIKFSD